MKTRKKDAKPELADSGPSFEEAMQRLETIVGDLEGADLPLEEILKKYEEGTKLVRLCGQRLEEAEKRIELLTRKADGTIDLKPFDPSESPAEEAESTPKEGEGRLF